jgi:hypothetical protein
MEVKEAVGLEVKVRDNWARLGEDRYDHTGHHGWPKWLIRQSKWLGQTDQVQLVSRGD